MDEAARILRIQPGNALASLEESATVRIGQEVMRIDAFENNRVDFTVNAQAAASIDFARLMKNWRRKGCSGRRS